MDGAPLDPPLYDPRFERDACGIGFVADAGRARRRDVLRLALDGLAALAHRGAFAADGETSDGAGIMLPLEPSLVALLAPGLGRRPAVGMLFLPGDPSAAAAVRDLAQRALRTEGLAARGWRSVPVVPDALGSDARASLPLIEQVIVPRPSGVRPHAFERRLLLARRRLELDAAAEGIEGFSVTSFSSRTVVYKGLVAGPRLAAFYPDLAAALELSHAVFHQRYATNTRPVWRLAQPFRLLGHNGEINTVRGNRQQVEGRTGATGTGWGDTLASLGPLLSHDGSDSLSLDEALDLLVASGWSLPRALLAAIPEAVALRTDGSGAAVAAFQERVSGFLSPWDGPAALVYSDGRHVGALLDRNGLRPLAFAVTHDRLVVAASEAGAVPIAAAETAHRGRLGPGEMLLVDVAAGSIRADGEAKRDLLGTSDAPRRERVVDLPRPATRSTPAPVRYLCGLDAERLRLSVRTMALEGHEPIWSMGDDTPLPGLSSQDRRAVDHIRQSFAQVTNPAIDAERERIVMSLGVELGRRPRLLAGEPRSPVTLPLATPIVADVGSLRAAFDRLRSPRGGARSVTLDATWNAALGPDGLAAALDRLTRDALAASRRGAELLVLSDRGVGLERLPVPSALAVGAVHAGLTGAGRRGETDLLVEASDVLDVHAAVVALAAGATAVSPWLALELAAELAGERGAEGIDADAARRNLLRALEAGLRKVLARLGISTVASYIGGQLVEVLELSEGLAARCFPAAPRWPGTVDERVLAERQLRRAAAAAGLGAAARLPDPGFARFRGDGERHLYAPAVVKALQGVAARAESDDALGDARARYRAALEREPALVRDLLRTVPAATPVPLAEVEPASRIVRRFVSAAMSLGSLSPEAHQALTLGMRALGAASNTGEGGEDPEWYTPEPSGRRRDGAIKQVASGRFGVTATYLARAEQLEIKIAQGSKPGEGGQLPGRKVTALIAALRRGRAGRSMISPPPHHDIYSIEDLAQLIADLRAINPSARVGVKLVATMGVGAIAAGVAKAGADYVLMSGHAGGTGASPLSSIKHVGIPWELGLAETHQVLLRNDLRDRVALRTDGGLQSGRDVVIAALLGAEEFGFGTAALVALGCDMARQCHLDTCPTGIATQREDLRAKFTGTPDDVVAFFLAVAEDARAELAALGARSIGEIVGDASRLAAAGPSTLELDRLLRAPVWTASSARRAEPASARDVVRRAIASRVEARLADLYLHLPDVEVDPLPPHLERASSDRAALTAREPITTAERSFGARITGYRERGLIRRPVSWTVAGAAGQSFGAFAGEGVDLELVGQANDYVGKGLGGGTVVVRPEPELRDRAAEQAIAGNACLYGATAGRLHLVGRAGIRFAVRNSGATAVVEGIGAHGCEYMTGGTVVVLGPVGRNLGAGMTGGRVLVVDPEGSVPDAIDRASVGVARLSHVIADRDDGLAIAEELRRLLLLHRDAGSARAAALLDTPMQLVDSTWLVEALPLAPDAAAVPVRGRPAGRETS